MKHVFIIACLALAACAATPEGTIDYDMGGVTYEYSMRYHDWDKRGIKPRVTGDCASACTLVLRNPDTCYTADARFYFHGVSDHGVYDAATSRAFVAAMPSGVRRWINETKALDSLEFTEISGRDLAAYDDRLCK